MKNTFSLCFLTFICFLIIGYSTSTFLFVKTNNNAEVTSITTAKENVVSMQSMKNGQRNILLITVDSITKEKPSLYGVWLLTYLPNDDHLNFLPIFPIGKSTISEAESGLYHSFSTLRENGKLLLDQKFINALKDQNYWWSGYMIFDQNVQENVLDFVTGSNNPPTEDQGAQYLPDVLDEPQTAFVRQLSGIKTACHYLSSSPNTDWSKLFFLISNQFYSDFDVQHLLVDWSSSTTYNPVQKCQFPTLQRHTNADYTILLTSVMK